MVTKDFPDDYWNHNTAYHPWLVDIAKRHNGAALDVGCGDGLLAQRLARVSRSVTAIDPDASAVRRATERLATRDNVAVDIADFQEFQPAGRRFDLITFVASLHHVTSLAAGCRQLVFMPLGHEGPVRPGGCCVRRARLLRRCDRSAGRRTALG